MDLESKRRKKKKGENGLGFTRLNYVLMAVGLALLVIGYIFLAVGDITVAPILLVLGYCVVIPAAILITGRSGKAPSEEKEAHSN